MPIVKFRPITMVTEWPPTAHSACGCGSEWVLGLATGNKRVKHGKEIRKGNTERDTSKRPLEKWRVYREPQWTSACADPSSDPRNPRKATCGQGICNPACLQGYAGWRQQNCRKFTSQLTPLTYAMVNTEILSKVRQKGRAATRSCPLSSI